MSREKIIKIVGGSILVGSGLLLLIYGVLVINLNIMLIGVTFFFLTNMIYALGRYKKRIVFLVFHLSLFLFLLLRPWMGFLGGNDWWNRLSQEKENYCAALIMIGISLIALFLGAVIAEQSNSILNSKKKEKKETEFGKYLQALSLLVFYITMLFYIVQEMEKVVFRMGGKGYLEYYAEFSSQLPMIIHTIASFMKYSLCLFLATLPNKRRAIIPLALFLISSIPALVVGVRNSIALNVIFVCIYFFIRDMLDEQEQWIGRIEKWSFAVMAPLAIIFFSAYAYIRGGKDVPLNPLELIIKFFDSQGITFDVLAIGYGYSGYFPKSNGKHYVLGGIIDYIKHGTVGQWLFGTEALPDGNNILNGTISNSFSHNLAYIRDREAYLGGRGWGSSYLIESYIDYGYWGVFIVSLILGVLLLGGVLWFGRKYMLSTIILVSLTTIFFMPRAETTESFLFLVTVQFWACMLSCYVGAYLVTKIQWMQKVFRHLKLC